MASEPKDYTIFIWMILTSNTEATENKDLAYTVKGFQCYSNNSLQLLELKGKTTTTKQYTLFIFFVIFFS